MNYQQVTTRAGTRDASFAHATVQAATEAGLIIHGASGVTTASIAVGCLVEPQVGDRVLVSDDGEMCFVLTVLRRSSPDRTIEVPGQLILSADSVTVSGRTRVDLGSSGSLGVGASSMALTSDELSIRSARVNVSGREANVHFRTARLVATGIETVSDRIIQCARNVVRKIEESETTYVRNLIQTVRENYFSRSKRTSITARKDVQVDGERIHMG